MDGCCGYVAHSGRSSRMDEASWARVAQFYYNGKLVSEQPVEQFLWLILFDAIHNPGPALACLPLSRPYRSPTI
jgi:hypothetical protein